jgi:transcriptional regulator with XRE-family HTH domain
MPPIGAERTSPFGARLRYWRGLRGASQMALALQAGTTSRHVSFLETGRSRPSREMVIRLSEVLDLSLRDRNRLLEAAGLAPAYLEAPVGAGELEPFRIAIERMLEAHEPYPAVVVDAHWNVLAINRPASALFGGNLVGTNTIRRAYGDPTTRAVIANWPDVAWVGLARLRHQLRRSPHDEELRVLVDLAEAACSELPPPSVPADDLVVCPHFRAGDRIIRTISLVARFDTAVEVTLDELRIELTYPQDAAAEEFFRELDCAQLPAPLGGLAG